MMSTAVEMLQACDRGIVVELVVAGAMSWRGVKLPTLVSCSRAMRGYWRFDAVDEAVKQTQDDEVMTTRLQ